MLKGERWVTVTSVLTFNTEYTCTYFHGHATL